MKTAFVFFLLLLQMNVFGQTEGVVGKWYYYRPESHKIMLKSIEYESYSFFASGEVVRSSFGENKTGTYTIHETKKELITKFDYGNGEINSATWKLEGDGKARIVYRMNLKNNIGMQDDLLYIKENSNEWRKYTKSKQAGKIPDRYPDAPRNLKVGKIYLLQKDVPLAPEIHPQDPMQALSRMMKLFAGSKITITERVIDGDVLWYKIVAFNTLTNEIITGWINYTALSGQKLNEVKSDR